MGEVMVTFMASRKLWPYLRSARVLIRCGWCGRWPVGRNHECFDEGGSG